MSKKTNEKEPELHEQMMDEHEEAAKKANAETNDAQDELEEPEEKDELTELQEKIAEMNEQHLRLRAEYDNFRKRTLREKSELISTAGRKILFQFLELLDDFDLAMQNLENAKDLDSIREGIDLIRSKFISNMRAQGVKEMEVLGEPFDADRYDAVAMMPTEDAKQKGCVLECVQKGYTLNDTVLRHPKVVVGQ